MNSFFKCTSTQTDRFEEFREIPQVTISDFSSLLRARPEGAHPEHQRQRERLHRGGAGPAGADVPCTPPRVLPRAGHQRGARGEDPQAAQHYAQKGEARDY